MVGPVLCFGEMLLRYSPAASGDQLATCPDFAVHVAGAEANVAIALASLGQPARMATVLADNPHGERALRTLSAYGVDTAHCRAQPGRLGAYFVENPRGGRESGFFYDRAGSAFALAEPGAINWETALEGAAWLHVSGITAALGDGPLALLHDAIDVAHELGIGTSFDCNFRPLLWTGREDQAAQILRDLAVRVEVVFASQWDESFMLGGKNLPNGLFALSDRVRIVAATQRRERDGIQELGVSARTHETTHIIEFAGIDPYLERLGSGDAFAAGFLYGLMQDWSAERSAQFAHRLCIMKHSIPGDFSTLDAALVVAALENPGRPD